MTTAFTQSALERRQREELDATLWREAADGNAAAVAAALAAGANPLSRSSHQMTPLMVASINGRAACVEVLIPAGGLEARQSVTKESALALAMRGGYPECASALLKAGARVDWRDSSGDSALAQAALWGHLDCVELGLMSGFVPTARNALRQTPLMMAARSGNSLCVEALLPRSDPSARDSHGMTAFLWAAAEGHAECVKALSPHSNLDATNREGANALALAASAHSDTAVDCVRLLMNKSAAKAIDRHGETPILKAIGKGRWSNALALTEVSDPRQTLPSGETLAQLTRRLDSGNRYRPSSPLSQQLAVTLETLAEALDLNDSMAPSTPSLKGARL